MDYPEPAVSETVVNDLWYRTKNAKLLAVITVEATLYHRYSYLFRTQKGNYFFQIDERHGDGTFWQSTITPCDLGRAVYAYQHEAQYRTVDWNKAFPEPIVDA